MVLEEVRVNRLAPTCTASSLLLSSTLFMIHLNPSDAMISGNTMTPVYPLANDAVGTNVTLLDNWMTNGAAVVWRTP